MDLKDDTDPKDALILSLQKQLAETQEALRRATSQGQPLVTKRRSVAFEGNDNVWPGKKEVSMFLALQVLVYD